MSPVAILFAGSFVVGEAPPAMVAAAGAAVARGGAGPAWPGRRGRAAEPALLLRRGGSLVPHMVPGGALRGPRAFRPPGVCVLVSGEPRAEDSSRLEIHRHFRGNQC